LRVLLVEASDGGGRPGLGVVGRKGDRLVEGSSRRDWMAQPLERDAVQELHPFGGPARERRELCRRAPRRHPGRRWEARNKGREAAVVLRVQEVVGANRRERVRLAGTRGAPGRKRLRALTGPVEREPEMELDEGVPRVRRGKLAQVVDRPVGPGGEG